MKTRTGFSFATLATAILLLCQTIQPTLAQDQDQGPPEPPNASQPDQPGPPDQVQPDQGLPDQDPPTRAGRLSFKEGSVSFQPGGQGDWVDAVDNRPLTTGDNFWVDKDSRAEIQIGATSIRVGPETSVTFLDLGNNVTQLRLSLGSLSFRVRHFDNGETFEVDTPNLAFNVNQPGEFRLDVNQNGDQTLATVFHGEGEVTGAGNSYRLTEGQQGTFSGTDQLTYDVAEIPQADAFTQWCESRDSREDRAQSRQYVSDEMTGYEDLDDYGRWQSDADYGNVWYPTGVAVGWAPYRFGHWAYVYPWGWTWVEDEPWGFAPFHYGRWAFIRGGWGWVPGPVAVSVRPVYAPALVAFVGGFSIGVGTAPVGWFPLGPREVYVPWYRTSPRYVENINVTNTRVTVVQVTNVYNNYRANRVTNVTYVNRRVANSVTVVNRETFINARPVHNNLVHVDARAMASARVGPGAVTQFRPARQSVIGVAHPVQYHPPAQAISRPVVVTRQPVAYRRPGAPAFARPTAPPPVRTVRAAPPGQAQPLQRGARGGPGNAGARPGGQPNNGPRPGAQPNAPQNGGVTGRPGGPAGQTNAPANRGYVPRPGAPGGQPNASENRGATPRPGAPAPQQNENTPRPGGPANGVRPNGPENSPRPGAPQYNNRNVPRPPSASPQNQGPQNQGAQQPQRQYPGTRPENNRPENSPQQAQPSRPVETPQARPDNNRPEYNPPAQQTPRQAQPPQDRPENNRPQTSPQMQQPTRPVETPQARPEDARPPEQTPRTMPQQPARAPEPRTEPSPRQPETRPAPPPREEQHNARPEARPAAPQRESRPAPQREQKPPKEEKPPKDKH